MGKLLRGGAAAWDDDHGDAAGDSEPAARHPTG
jgi:hypothetical protein